MSGRRRTGRYIAAALGLFLLAGIAAPFLSADRFGDAIRAALETSLGRKIEIGKARFHLFGVPGFTLQDVVIHEDPAFGIEPFAWVDSLHARPNFVSLLRGRLEFSSLDLEDPTVNLVKTRRWNFEPLLTSGLIASLPRISVSGARVNFKFGDTKSVFYVTNTGLDIAAPRRAGDSWAIEFSGEPARTDRAARGLGSFKGKGQWRPDRLQLDVDLQRSAIGEMIALVYGRDIGVHGAVSARVRLEGSLPDVRVAGQVHVEELHRWDQMPMKGAGWPLAFQGRLNVAAQTLELESRSDGRTPLPIAIRYRVSDYLAQPRWGVNLTWSRFPAEPLAAIARHMGAPLPAELKLAGTLDGAIGYTAQGGLQGSIVFNDAVIDSPGSRRINLDSAGVLFDGDLVRLEPVDLRSGGAGAIAEARVEGEYRWASGDLDVTVSGDEMNVAALPFEASLLPAPFLATGGTGSWKGRLRYRRQADAPAEWTGQVQLRDADVSLDGVADPLRIQSAQAQISGARLTIDKLRARIGAIEIVGHYVFEPEAVRPHRFSLNVPEADAAELERLLLPTLRRRQGFISRTLGLGGEALPDWLSARHAAGRLRIGELTVPGARFRDVRARFTWDAGRVVFSGVQAKVEDGTASGEVSVNLLGRPVYRLALQLDNIEWMGGRIDADTTIEARGTGLELLTGLRTEGSFHARGLDLGDAREIKTVSGCYRFDWIRSAPRLRFTELQLAVGDDLYLGRGATQTDGRLLWQLSSGGKQMRVSGTLAQLRVEN